MSQTGKKLLAAGLAVVMIGSVVAVTAQVQQHDDAEPSQQTSYLRVAHASPDAPAVDVQVENETVVSDLPFGNVTEYLTLDAGTYNVTITAADDPTIEVFNGTLSIEARSVTTLAASGEVTAGSETSFEPVLFDDDAFAPGPNESALSVVHLSPDAPAVDVTTADGTVLAENVTFRNATDYVNVPAGNYTVDIRAATAANNGTVVTSVDVSLDGGTVYSAMAVGYLDATTADVDEPLSVVLTEDAQTTVHLPSEMDTNATATPTPGATVTETPDETVTETVTGTETGETATPTETGEETATPTEAGEETATPTEAGEETATPTEAGEGTPTATEAG
jgi:hypothetical protein